MALPYTFTNVGNPVIDATQFNANFQYLDSGKVREATVTGVAADGGNTVIYFSSPFNNTVGPITFGVSNYSGSDNAALSAPRIVGDASLSGFTVTIGGGQSGSTVTLHYRASGT